MKLVLFAAACLVTLATAASAQTLAVDLTPDRRNPTSPEMGDNLAFHTVIRNTDAQAANGVIAWISLVQTDRGKEQPIDLEDWSAHKAVTATALAPGQTLATDWPMRLIQAGNYRVVVSAATMLASPPAPLQPSPCGRSRLSSHSACCRSRSESRCCSPAPCSCAAARANAGSTRRFANLPPAGISLSSAAASACCKGAR
jgi:hypothetical protein